jgi:hypothetical protein
LNFALVRGYFARGRLGHFLSPIPMKSSPVHSWVCWSLAGLFAARVLGQAVQRVLPQPFLPPFDAFQGSRLPYALLLGAQVVILAAMALASWRIQRRRLVPVPRIGSALRLLGVVYMPFALTRIVIGWAVPDANAWFRAWIPAVFHVVLAAFVLTLAHYHLAARGARKRAISLRFSHQGVIRPRIRARG